MPEKMTLHYKDGSTTSIDAIDARRVLRDHPSEWSTSPFPADVQKEAKIEASQKREMIAEIKLSSQPQHKIDAALEELEARHQEQKALDDAAARSGKPRAAAKAEPKGPFATKAKEAGWYGIFDADGKQVGKNMRKDDAAAFDAMSDEDKLEYVKAELADS